MKQKQFNYSQAINFVVKGAPLTRFYDVEFTNETSVDFEDSKGKIHAVDKNNNSKFNYLDIKENGEVIGLNKKLNKNLIAFC